MLQFINYCVTGREAIELSASIIFISQGETAPKQIWTNYDLICTTAYLVKIILLQLVLTLYMLADTSWKTVGLFWVFFPLDSDKLLEINRILSSSKISIMLDSCWYQSTIRLCHFTFSGLWHILVLVCIFLNFWFHRDRLSNWFSFSGIRSLSPFWMLCDFARMYQVFALSVTSNIVWVIIWLCLPASLSRW